MAVPDVLSTLDAVYETVLDPRRWPDVLDRVTAFSGAHGTMLFVSDPVMTELEAVERCSNYDATAVGAYTSGQLAGSELRWIEMLDECDALHVLHDTEIWPDRVAYDAMPSVQWLRAQHLYHRSAVRLCSHGGWRDLIAMIYAEGRGSMTEEEEARLQPLLPHLARALEIRRPFALLRSRYSAVLSMLDRLGIGVIVLGQRDQIVLCNAEAERILETGDALRRRRDGRLGLAGEESGRTELAAALAQVANGQAFDGTTVYLGRGLGRDPYVADVASFRESGIELDEPLAGTLICLIDPERRSLISTSALTTAYGLTAAEAEVCRLIATGLTAREIADERGVSLDTVKTQSRTVLSKAAARNRAELVRRAMSISPPLLDTSGRREDD